MRISAILLASGLSRRMGSDKLLLEYNEKTVIQRSVDLLSALPVFERFIVTSDARSDHISIPPGVRLLINSRPEEGIGGSIKKGAEAAAGTHFFFLTADQPGLQ